MVVICAALLAALIAGLASWGVLGLSWPLGFLVLVALLILAPLGAVAGLGLLHRVAPREGVTQATRSRSKN